MSIIKILENKATAHEKELFLNGLHDNILSDLWLIYGRLGTAPREEKIAVIANCGKSRDEKIKTLVKAFTTAKHAKDFFSAIGDTTQVAVCTRTYKRMKAWRRDF